MRACREAPRRGLAGTLVISRSKLRRNCFSPDSTSATVLQRGDRRARVRDKPQKLSPRSSCQPKGPAVGRARSPQPPSTPILMIFIAISTSKCRKPATNSVFARARRSRYPGCPGPIENGAPERQRSARLRRPPTRRSKDASKKIVYYPVTTWRPAGQRVSGSELLVKNNDVWFRQAVDACSGEGLQTVNGPATV